MQNETILRLIMTDADYIEGKSSDIMHLFPFKDGTINTRYRGVCTHQEGGKTEVRFTLFHENEGIRVAFPGDTAALFLAFLLKRGLALDVLLDEVSIKQALLQVGIPSMFTSGKPECEHTRLLVRCYDESYRRVSLIGDEIDEKEGITYVDDEFMGEVGVECHEENCTYFQTFTDWNWENAPEPLRSRIAKAVDECYS